MAKEKIEKSRHSVVITEKAVKGLRKKAKEQKRTLHYVMSEILEEAAK